MDAIPILKECSTVQSIAFMTWHATKRNVGYTDKYKCRLNLIGYSSPKNLKITFCNNLLNLIWFKIWLSSVEHERRHFEKYLIVDFCPYSGGQWALKHFGSQHYSKYLQCSTEDRYGKTCTILKTFHNAVVDLAPCLTILHKEAHVNYSAIYLLRDVFVLLIY